MFPCIVGGKEPACAGGFKAATIDPGQIDAWWSEADYNVALCPEDCGWAVIDIDGPEGETTWGTLRAEHLSSTPTYTVETPRGGRHLYYAGSVKSTVQTLGPKVDTRGVGGYVLIPPSIVGGKSYAVTDDRDPADLPGWLPERLATRTESHAALITEVDTAPNIARARRLLDDCVGRSDIAIDGSGGNDRTYRLACQVQNLGLSPERCQELLEEIWNPHCEPPWDSDELQAICEHAAEYAQNEAGANGVAPAQEVFGPTLNKLGLNTPEPARRSRFLTLTEMAALPDPVWLVPGLLMDSSTCLMVGSWGTYKSFLALDLGMALATGKPTFGLTPARTGPVFYAALEGRVGIGKSRSQAWCEARGVIREDVPLYVGPAPLIKENEDCQNFIDDIRAAAGERRPALVIIDTLSQAMAGLDETRDGNLLIKMANDLAGVLQCAVLVIHHFGHDTKLGARGGTIYPAGFDTYLEVEGKEEMRVEVRVKKQKEAEARKHPFTLKGRKVKGSLVFDTVAAAEHNAAMAELDPFHRLKVGAALSALHAVGEETKVTTHVLASQLVPPVSGETPEEHQALIDKAVKSLRALAKDRLAAYCTGTGRDLEWFMPEAHNE